MERVPEPELMESDEQAEGYALADFEAPHERFVQLFRECFPGEPISGAVADLGCGPGDVCLRFARTFPGCEIHGIDGSEAMLRWGEILRSRAEPDVAARVRLIRGLLPDAPMPLPRYATVISNSLLHQLHDPAVLWRSVRRLAAPGARVFVCDLRRPCSVEEARALQERYASGGLPAMRRDFFNSLLAAFEPAEIEGQLHAADLRGLQVEPVGDRHVIVHGRMG